MTQVTARWLCASKSNKRQITLQAVNLNSLAFAAFAAYNVEETFTGAVFENLKQYNDWFALFVSEMNSRLKKLCVFG